MSEDAPEAMAKHLDVQRSHLSHDAKRRFGDLIVQGHDLSRALSERAEACEKDGQMTLADRSRGAAKEIREIVDKLVDG